MTEAQARREGAKIAADVRAGRIVFDDVPSTAPTTAGELRTVRQLGEAWTSGKLLAKYGKVNRLRVKAGAQIDVWCFAANAYDVHTRGPGGPTFGELAVANVTEDDIAKVMAAQPKKHRAATLTKQYNRLHRLFDLAIFPLRARKDNPVTRYLRPQPDAEKLFCFLYPTELLALLRGRDKHGKVVIPLGRRVLYALAVYTGQRKGSLYALTWKHADFDHGTLASFKTKTGRAQYFVADRGLMTSSSRGALARGRSTEQQRPRRASSRLWQRTSRGPSRTTTSRSFATSNVKAARDGSPRSYAPTSKLLERRAYRSSRRTWRTSNRSASTTCDPRFAPGRGGLRNRTCGSPSARGRTSTAR